jgi:hypothetical protein
MIDLIYNDGQKTVMYTHDKEIIYESEADRVQVVEYPPPPPSPPTPSPPSGRNGPGLIPVNCVARSATTPGGPTTLQLHYSQLHFHHEQDLPRALANGTAVPIAGAGPPTTTTVLVLSELVAADPGQTGTPAHLTLATAAASLRSG